MEKKSWKQTLIQCFDEVYHDHKDVEVFFAPGRVNLIGEHIDYNGGHVFPCALTIGTYIAARKTSNRQIRAYSKNFEEAGVKTISMDSLHYDANNEFANYPFGVIDVMLRKGYPITTGVDLCIYGDLISNSGLSSSASVEVVTAFALSELYNLHLDFVTISLIAKEAENAFVGVNCGIMDQFAIAMGKAEHAIYLNTNTLRYEYAPIQLKDDVMIIANTNKKRGLGDSKYNERRRECEEALRRIKTMQDIPNLCVLTQNELVELKDVIQDETLYKRARHVVTENERTKRALMALSEHNIKEFGTLMTQSHQSLRTDYEVTGVELDTLVDAALQQPETVGSRMTGAGFGGCTISIVKKEAVEHFIYQVKDSYRKEIGYAPDCYLVQAGCGPYHL